MQALFDVICISNVINVDKNFLEGSTHMKTGVNSLAKVIPYIYFSQSASTIYALLLYLKRNLVIHQVEAGWDMCQLGTTQFE